MNVEIPWYEDIVLIRHKDLVTHLSVETTYKVTMGTLSPDRRHHWTRRTSYASLVSDRAPLEVGNGAQAIIKTTEFDLEKNHKCLKRMERKSLFALDSQRKQLQKSMLAYSNKMKQISDSRTSDLFREIHTRNSSHPVRGTKSLTLSVDSVDSDPSAVKRLAGLATHSPRPRDPSNRRWSDYGESITHKSKQLRRKNRPSSADNIVILTTLTEENTLAPSPSRHNNSRRPSNLAGKDNTEKSPMGNKTDSKTDVPGVFTSPRIHKSKKITKKLKTGSKPFRAVDSFLNIHSDACDSSDSAYSSCGEELTNVESESNTDKTQIEGAIDKDLIIERERTKYSLNEQHKSATVVVTTKGMIKKGTEKSRKDNAQSSYEGELEHVLVAPKVHCRKPKRQSE